MSLCPLRSGVIGLGYFGARHARIYGDLPDSVLVAVSDRHPERVGIAAALGAAFHADYAELLARPDIDAVSICLPDRQHTEAAIAKLPNERDIARQLKTSRTAVRAALAMMERQGLIRRRVGSGTFLTDDADQVFGRMDQTMTGAHENVPSFVEIVEGRLLFEPAMMHLVVSRVEERELEAMRATLEEILHAPTWRAFKERIYALHQLMFTATKNRFLTQIMDDIVADRRAVLFDGKDTEKPAPAAVRKQTHKELAAIVNAIAARQPKLAEELTSDHLMRTLATINIWQ